MLKKVAICLTAVLAEDATDMMHIWVSPKGRNELVKDVNQVGSALKEMSNDKRNMNSIKRQFRQWEATPEYKAA